MEVSRYKGATPIPEWWHHHAAVRPGLSVHHDPSTLESHGYNDNILTTPQTLDSRRIASIRPLLALHVCGATVHTSASRRGRDPRREWNWKAHDSLDKIAIGSSTEPTTEEAEADLTMAADQPGSVNLREEESEGTEPESLLKGLPGEDLVNIPITMADSEILSSRRLRVLGCPPSSRRRMGKENRNAIAVIMMVEVTGEGKPTHTKRTSLTVILQHRGDVATSKHILDMMVTMNADWNMSITCSNMSWLKKDGSPGPGLRRCYVSDGLQSPRSSIPRQHVPARSLQRIICCNTGPSMMMIALPLRETCPRCSENQFHTGTTARPHTRFMLSANHWRYAPPACASQLYRTASYVGAAWPRLVLDGPRSRAVGQQYLSPMTSTSTARSSRMINATKHHALNEDVVPCEFSDVICTLPSMPFINLSIAVLIKMPSGLVNHPDFALPCPFQRRHVEDLNYGNVHHPAQNQHPSRSLPDEQRKGRMINLGRLPVHRRHDLSADALPMSMRTTSCHLLRENHLRFPPQPPTPSPASPPVVLAPWRSSPWLDDHDHDECVAISCPHCPLIIHQVIMTVTKANEEDSLDWRGVDDAPFGSGQKSCQRDDQWLRSQDRWRKSLRMPRSAEEIDALMNTALQVILVSRSNECYSKYFSSKWPMRSQGRARVAHLAAIVSCSRWLLEVQFLDDYDDESLHAQHGGKFMICTPVLNLSSLAREGQPYSDWKRLTLRHGTTIEPTTHRPVENPIRQHDIIREMIPLSNSTPSTRRLLVDDYDCVYINRIRPMNNIIMCYDFSLILVPIIDMARVQKDHGQEDDHNEHPDTWVVSRVPAHNILIHAQQTLTLWHSMRCGECRRLIRNDDLGHPAAQALEATRYVDGIPSSPKSGAVIALSTDTDFRALQAPGGLSCLAAQTLEGGHPLARHGFKNDVMAIIDMYSLASGSITIVFANHIDRHRIHQGNPSCTAKVQGPRHFGTAMLSLSDAVLDLMMTIFPRAVIAMDSAKTCTPGLVLRQREDTAGDREMLDVEGRLATETDASQLHFTTSRRRDMLDVANAGGRPIKGLKKRVRMGMKRRNPMQTKMAKFSEQMSKMLVEDDSSIVKSQPDFRNNFIYQRLYRAPDYSDQMDEELDWDRHPHLFSFCALGFDTLRKSATSSRHDWPPVSGGS
ncbi:uncharacterized protein MYCFIDRAFT_180232 [Pseudocercospora fijiensis CIRAD86]|uniref:Uncharacterized protein n=1 Tax=Pseudocercospora fijiensis (strain CIRAD86) TaxID=383855 RepID=M3AHU5_PSEFD|nr:uncharacterized protein MYCFIDRAFT_180232 [Pseudocercospora fijiensis CIRAD86]EME77087.1 hypothetical protein MYCFIDRAFT_180232 [Pseudocercospora fijiensis CIRAD86]